MKKVIIFFAAVAIIAYGCTALSSCSTLATTVAKATGFSWSGTATITVPPVSDTLLHASMGTGTVTYNLDSLIKSETKNTLGLSNIDTFEITSAVLTIQNPDSADNFANFKQAQFSFSTSSNSTTANMGEIDNNPDSYSPTLSIPVNNTVNLKSYVSPLGMTTITYSLGGQLRRVTTATLTINVDYNYYVHVTP